MIEDSFEYRYHKIFKGWFDGIKKLTNNFDKNIKEIFTIPYHISRELVDIMVSKYKISDIPILVCPLTLPVANFNCEY